MGCHYAYSYAKDAVDAWVQYSFANYLTTACFQLLGFATLFLTAINSFMYSLRTPFCFYRYWYPPKPPAVRVAVNDPLRVPRVVPWLDFTPWRISS
ncbi:uncharacterized protein J8A68_000145 [[Candida] subhashii]|uniref:Uncharacterized protein n=1 Tax=[Candida] subhashii TaxID=561895 RepID=A0A8J5QUH5_9ASCO|nr:uncharacterized protein J8A68_000145 [[Candida] subhashii]KAG7666308.1 hypothetical protein J8A68_000145 [[Candida] subhashii]